MLLIGNAVLLFLLFPSVIPLFPCLPSPPNSPCPFCFLCPSHVCRVELCWSTTGSRLAQRQDLPSAQKHPHTPPRFSWASPVHLAGNSAVRRVKKWTSCPVEEKCFVLFCFIVKKNMAKGKADCLEGELHTWYKRVPGPGPAQGFFLFKGVSPCNSCL